MMINIVMVNRITSNKSNSHSSKTRLSKLNKLELPNRIIHSLGRLKLWALRKQKNWLENREGYYNKLC